MQLQPLLRMTMPPVESPEASHINMRKKLYLSYKSNAKLDYLPWEELQQFLIRTQLSA